ncbi:MAG: DUF1501 domain-containing protein, partial [Planctomycetota bacterium]|nr:DUF1501 domain-containing protein [Planctomycetota bacterium]
MFSIRDQGTTLCDGISRREALRVGGLGLGGLSLAGLLKNRAQANPAGSSNLPGFGKTKSVIVFGLVGGLPQHETWDPKPSAPEEIRGEFGTTPSKTPGYHVGELMPKTALLTDKIAVLRGVVTNDNAHSSSGYQMLTGIEHNPLNRENALPGPPNNHPSLAAVVRALREDKGLPSSIVLPEHIWNDGNKPWPGQNAGFIGRAHDPWLIKCYPQENRFDVPGMTLAEELTQLRVNHRQTLLSQINQAQETLAESDAVSTFNLHAQKAYSLLGAGAARDAFDLSKESASCRERYGESRFAQSCLLARRLVEAEVSLVQINWTRVVDDRKFENQGGWDTHKKHSQSLKEHLMPSMDQTFSALIEDLDQRGMLDETLVIMFSEFGHT